ncbi:TonB-dependent receptor [Niabella beijingensis]|uniref:TonB-dependent receptor n=1 Tax=Niabella beijingensis TaxID=2872700 RepID=UPI001CBB516A|nr:TonB-dependent receptor [Niabella beijingensis]MBZ4191203.1 TonB-dependent receptor [Niabella beijingensis]
MIRSAIKIRQFLHFLLLVVCAHIHVAGAAQNNKEIKGRVMDENGNPVANATVLAKNKSTSQTVTTQTDTAGVFTYDNLAVGNTYSFVVSHVGFQTQTISRYDINAGSNEPLVIQLRSTTNDLKEVIVTGRAGAQNRTKLETSYSVTSIGYNALSLQAPTSVTEALKSVPGFWVESSGGEGSGNVRARGVPVDGYGSIQLLEDGVPVQHDPSLGYLNADQVFRLDETIQSIEVVRGGPSSVFYSNAPAGAVNYIPRAVGDKTEGSFKLALGSQNFYRGDFWVGAPIGDGWKLSAGGFYRAGAGVRDPGFSGNHGGQFRVSIGKKWEKSSFDVDFKRLDDNVIFYLGIPMTRQNGKIVAVPGINGNYGTIAGPETQRVNMIQGDGSLYRFDNTVGTSVQRSQVTAKFKTEIFDKWILKNTLRYDNTHTQRNGVYPNTLLTADSMLSGQSALLATVPGAQRLGLQYVSTGASFNNANENGNGLVILGGIRGLTLPLTEVANDLHLSRVFITGSSKHDFNFGYYYSHFDEDFTRYSSVALLDVQNNARLLNLVAMDANGKVLRTFTDNGIYRYGYEWADAHGEQTTNAVYVSDEWQITPAFRIDAGLRWENAQTKGVVEQSKSVNLGTFATSNVLTGNGIFQSYDHGFNFTTWTAGANYQFSNNMGAFARYTSAARIPGLGAYVTNATAKPVTQTMQLGEVGYKYSSPVLSLYATGFWTKYNNVGFTNYVFNPDGNQTQENLYANTQTFGLELEGGYFPVKWFDISATATLQRGRYKGYVYTDNSGKLINYNDNQLIRVPAAALRVIPGFNFFGDKVRLQTVIEYVGQRYVDVANSVSLPSYTKIDINAEVKLNNRISLFGLIDNLGNSLGLTEGNPRQGEFQSNDAGATSFIARPLVGRSFRASLRYKF